MAPHASVYSRRGKLGLITPPTNTVNEAEWARLVPEGVTFHTMRMPLHPGTATPEQQEALQRDLARSMGDLMAARVDVIAYACTAGSMVYPPESIVAGMETRSGRACVTTAAAIVRALTHLGVRRLAIATPYHDALNVHETHFLEECGFEVATIAGLDIGANGPQDYVRIAETPLDKVVAHARGVMTADAEALLISCTDFPTLPIIATLEAEFGVPVVSSNTATFWAALRAAGIADVVSGAGRLLAG